MRVPCFRSWEPPRTIFERWRRVGYAHHRESAKADRFALVGIARPTRSIWPEKETMSFETLGLFAPIFARRRRRRLHHPHPHSITGHSASHGRPRSARMRADGHRQNGPPSALPMLHRLTHGGNPPKGHGRRIPRAGPLADPRTGRPNRRKFPHLRPIHRTAANGHLWRRGPEPAKRGRSSTASIFSSPRRAG